MPLVRSLCWFDFYGCTVQCAASHKRANAYQQSFYRCFTESSRYFSLDCTGFVATSWSQWTLVLWRNNTWKMSTIFVFHWHWIKLWMTAPHNHIYCFSSSDFSQDLLISFASQVSSNWWNSENRLCIALPLIPQLNFNLNKTFEKGQEMLICLSKF